MWRAAPSFTEWLACKTLACTVLPALSCRLQGISDADVGTLQGVLEEAVQVSLGGSLLCSLQTRQCNGTETAMRCAAADGAGQTCFSCSGLHTPPPADPAPQENLGMAMIYTLITTAQEWVQVRLSGAAVGSRS